MCACYFAIFISHNIYRSRYNESCGGLFNFGLILLYELTKIIIPPQDKMNAFRFNSLLRKLNNDTGAFEQIYSEYYPVVVLHIQRCYGNLVVAEDIAQDLFLKLLNITPNDTIKYPTAWLFKLAENIAVDEIRKHTCEAPLKDIVPAPFNIDVLIQNADLKTYFLSLDETSQKILYMFYWEGYSFKEIAIELNLKYSSLRVKVFRAYSKLKNKMKHF